MSGRQRLAESSEAGGGVAVAGPPIQLLLDRGKGFGAVDLADGFRSGAACDRMHGGREKIRQHPGIAAGTWIDAVRAEVTLHGVAPPIELCVGPPDQKPRSRVGWMLAREEVDRAKRALRDPLAAIEAIADPPQGGWHCLLPGIASRQSWLLHIIGLRLRRRDF